MDTATANVMLRPLARDDLAAVVAIDSAIEGRSRRHYFERRLQAALQEPKLHAQFAATDERGLAGFLLARVLEGEFGQSEPTLRLEGVGVRANAQGAGIGERLLGALTEWARRHGIYEVRTQASWKDHAMLRWLDAMGFHVAPNYVLDCAVRGGEYLPARDDPVHSGAGDAPREVAYDGHPDNDYERLARDLCDVRGMRPEDVPDIVRIDRHITGRDRGEYVRRKLAETLTDSAIRVSLTARQDDAVAGYLMARVDLGDFGRTEPTAVIDTIGVDPAWAHRGIGHALVSQLFANLGALQVERVETIVAPRDHALSGFLYDVGFGPSQRIAFVCPL
jgi:ribosomal protein S18 acetylase RimI-like enzyme